MLIRKSVANYKHIDFGNIKLAFTQVCKDELFKDVYFAANSLYYVESGSAELTSQEKKLTVRKGEIVLIRQHSKLDIRKFKEPNGNDFRSVIFYLFPDFVNECLKRTKHFKADPDLSDNDLIYLGKQAHLKAFCESLLPLFENQKIDNNLIREKTFEAVNHLARENAGFLAFLANNSRPIKIDLYEFMIHIAVYDYSVRELARLTGRSLSAFKRDFASVFETTPHKWLLKKKIDYAEHLIVEKKMKAANIYTMLGFNELSHFSAAFKKIKGLSPTRILQA